MAGNRSATRNTFLCAELCMLNRTANDRAWQGKEGRKNAYGLVGDDAELSGGTVTAAADELERGVARGHAAA